MTGDVVNLRQFRKQKARSEKEKQAEQNRLSFGRTKSEKSLTTALNDKAERQLDQGKLDRQDDESE
ncbi:DUF4169 family protein [Agrobacterium tumefaciens]|jgi:hypothetical protein|uniref:DUF4169 domain-containing protein n=1 Tax=Rhizobium rhizogenes TaxID=359 RepID=A0AA92C651_RHIRH|nr:MULTISPECIES: DUF4169 family protein [Rhizobium/Agrobacterium group]KQM33821.1 hypothetical protein ASE62_08910 [Rhizobium sp. Leaf202]KQN85780.1 hypothetical protein ASF03_09020 [Rhizobium sp. Leaf68]MQB21781.1 DUF4169 family protein [Agrobacterium tumefaciens]PVE78548.1 DUF4169 domain-containing protein [Sphingomonas sp. TPD3009]PVE56688.1 DUF4169 domain-containing protein [Rhizobium rhizogenes]